MQRRRFITLLAAIAGWPTIGRTQQPKTTVIGVLAGLAPQSEHYRNGLIEALRERGYIEGQNVRYEFRLDEPANQLPDLAAELVRLKVDVIVTRFTPATMAAKQATRDIPIVMAFAGNPVETGLIESVALIRPH